MAIVRDDFKEVEIPDGSPIREAAEELGVIFGCYGGSCGTCMITIEEGEENLNPLNASEENFGLVEGEGKRLSCQCSIIGGEVKINYEDF